MTSRIAHIDVAKAIGMMLIITSHIWISKDLSESQSFVLWDNVINSFYIPLFFLLSGIFEPSDNSLRKSIARLAKLLKYILIFGVYGIVSDGIIYGKLSFHSYSAAPIWFLISLLIITAVFAALKSVKYKWLYISVLSGGAYVIGKYGHSCFYFGPAMLCIPFYAVGFQFKDRFKREDFNLKYCAVSFFVWLLGFVLICRSPQNVAMNLVSQNYFTFYVIAISGSVFVMEISKLVNCEFIGWFGRNTIVPMMVHVTFRIVIGKIMLAETMIFYFAFAVAVIIVSSVFIPLFRNKKYDLFK